MISGGVSVQSADTTILIVCASYLFVFMSNSLDKTNTVTTQKRAVLAARYVHVTFCFVFFLKKSQNIISASIIFSSLK